eukprot:gnl/Dysnectes_brevis/6207_a9457_368.p1 GENE.gnl/Dysnectes_brevis/6207_a9457_368~~gnl/Dysnectes_brevis/6207_a9457_368.p1  ORF type:complete len:946 (+),score=165.69 gnl/Dysnectes_brevis/6207_a9457_368:102-2939(+)
MINFLLILSFICLVFTDRYIVSQSIGLHATSPTFPTFECSSLIIQHQDECSDPSGTCPEYVRVDIIPDSGVESSQSMIHVHMYAVDSNSFTSTLSDPTTLAATKYVYESSLYAPAAGSYDAFLDGDFDLDISMSEKLDIDFYLIISTLDGVILLNLDSSLLIGSTKTEISSSFGHPTLSDPSTMASFGFGERTDSKQSERLRVGQKMTMWAEDPCNYDYDAPFYSVHPIHASLIPAIPDVSTRWSGLVYLSARAMEAELTAHDAIRVTATGGEVPLTVFSAASHSGFMSTYRAMTGPAAVPPGWALGYGQSRYGYHNVSELIDVVEGYTESRIPLTTLWSDVDINDRKSPFTVDSENYPADDMRTLVSALHSNDQKYVAIVDPAVRACGVDTAYADCNERDWELWNQGVDRNAFILDPANLTSPLVAEMLPGNSSWINFFTEEGQTWWADLYNDWEAVTGWPLDGVWLDQSEPRTKGVGSRMSSMDCDWDIYGPHSSLPDVVAEYAPWTPENRDLEVLTFPYNTDYGRDGSGRPNNVYHSMWGLSEARAVQKSVKQAHPDEKPFVLSRSTFPSSSSVASHWFGDSNTTWIEINDAIAQASSFTFFNLQHIGSDIGGFHLWDDADPYSDENNEIAARWLQVGSLSPFCRAHAHKQPAVPREMYVSCPETARASLYARLRLLPQFMALHHRAELTGECVWCSLGAYLGPEDPAAVPGSGQAGLETTWGLGRELLCYGVAEYMGDKRTLYLPVSGVSWYPLFPEAPYALSVPSVLRGGNQITLDLPVVSTPGIMIREGEQLITAGGACAQLPLDGSMADEAAFDSCGTAIKALEQSKRLVIAGPGPSSAVFHGDDESSGSGAWALTSVVSVSNPGGQDQVLVSLSFESEDDAIMKLDGLRLFWDETPGRVTGIYASINALNNNAVDIVFDSVVVLHNGSSLSFVIWML